MIDVDLNALGQAIDTTFGRSSTPNASSFSVKISFGGGNRLLASYAAVVNFATSNQKINLKQRYVEESIDVIAQALKKVKSIYKDLTGKSLKLKEVGSNDSFEMIDMNVVTPRRTAYFRRKTIVEFA